MEYDVTCEFKTVISVRVKGEDHDDAYGEAECQLCEVFDTGRWTEEVKLALAQAVMNRAVASRPYDLVVIDGQVWRIEEVKLALEQAAANRMDDHYPLPVSVTEGQVRIEPAH